MSAKKISNFALALGWLSTVLAGFVATAFAKDDLLVRTVASRRYRHEGMISVLIGVGAQAGVPVSIEDVPEVMKGSLNAIRVDYDTKESSTLRSVLDALTKKTGAFAWQQDGPAVNVVALALKNDNPFDEKIAPFDFKGTQEDFVFLMNQKAKSLNASLLGFGRTYSGNPDAVILFQTKETLSLRQVFNRFGSAAGLRWHAELRELTKAPASGFFPPSRTVVSFFICEEKASRDERGETNASGVNQ